jgi:phosphatidylcholine synthase
MLRPAMERPLHQRGARSAGVPSSTARPRSAARLAAAWAVHVLTASGALVGLAALLEVAAGRLRAAALLMLVGLFIDSVDGTLARAARVSEVVPRIDGRRLDDIVDYLNYVIVPAVFLVAAGAVAHWAVAGAAVLASAYGFSQEDAKTEDEFFLGFPSYWNVLAIYLWGLGIGPGAGSALVLGFAAAVFVPIKYLYPSRTPVLRRTTAIGAAVWLALIVFAVASRSDAGDPLPASNPLAQLPLLELSLLFPAWYLGLSFAVGGLRRSHHAAEHRS